jgi:hypothetical protein
VLDQRKAPTLSVHFLFWAAAFLFGGRCEFIGASSRRLRARLALSRCSLPSHPVERAFLRDRTYSRDVNHIMRQSWNDLPGVILKTELIVLVLQERRVSEWSYNDDSRGSSPEKASSPSEKKHKELRWLLQGDHPPPTDCCAAIQNLRM